MFFVARFVCVAVVNDGCLKMLLLLRRLVLVQNIRSHLEGFLCLRKLKGEKSANESCDWQITLTWCIVECVQKYNTCSSNVWKGIVTLIPWVLFYRSGGILTVFIADCIWPLNLYKKFPTGKQATPLYGHLIFSNLSISKKNNSPVSWAVSSFHLL